MTPTSIALPGLSALALLLGLSTVEAPATRSLRGAAAHVDALTLGGETAPGLVPLMRRIPAGVLEGDAGLDPLDPYVFQQIRGRVVRVIEGQRTLRAETYPQEHARSHGKPEGADDGFLPGEGDFDTEEDADRAPEPEEGVETIAGVGITLRQGRSAIEIRIARR